MDMGISGSLKPYVSTNENTYSADSEIQGTWTHIAFEINLLTVSIYRNGVQLILNPNDQLDDQIVDVDNSHSVGEILTGFLYSMCMYNYAHTDYDIDVSPSCLPLYECTNCPIGMCLSE